MPKAIVIGGGAAGMLSAILLSQRGCQVTLLEKNEKLGKKIFITGKGRCNLTNDCDADDFYNNVVSNPRFLYSAYNQCSSQDIQKLFEAWGLKIKVERGKRVFPESDHAYDVIDTLKRQLIKHCVRIELNTKALGLITKTDSDGNIKAVGVKTAHETLMADRVIVATGGLSYPSTGSTGDGHRMLENLGHRLTDCRPSLVGITCAEIDVSALQKLTLKNVTFTVKQKKKVLYKDFGELTFMSYGISGPLALTASARTGKYMKKEPLTAEIDLKPTVDDQKLDANLQRLLKDKAKKDVIHAIRELYPSVLVPILLDRADIDPHKKAYEISKKERQAILDNTRHFRLTLTGLRGYEEAIVTQGGVSVKDVEPATMASKKVSGLYIVGELLDLDALTGGFNLQIAWTTAFAAANA